MTYSNDYLSNVTDDYRPPHVRHADRVVEMFKNEPVAFRERPAALQSPLNEIASLVRILTYGEMVELSAGIGVSADVVHGWAQKMP